MISAWEKWRLRYLPSLTLKSMCQHNTWIRCVRLFQLEAGQWNASICFIVGCRSSVLMILYFSKKGKSLVCEGAWEIGSLAGVDQTVVGFTCYGIFLPNSSSQEHSKAYEPRAWQQQWRVMGWHGNPRIPRGGFTRCYMGAVALGFSRFTVLSPSAGLWQTSSVGYHPHLGGLCSFLCPYRLVLCMSKDEEKNRT